MLTVSRQLAQEMGFTNEGHIAGVPCWLTLTPDGIDVAAATPKFQPLQVWMSMADMLYDAITWLMPQSWHIEFPIKVGATLK